MIEFNEHDFNLTKVKRESKLFNLVTRFKYRVYGLRQNDNPAVLIEYHYDKVDDKFKERLEVLCNFIRSNGIEIETFSESETPRVDVGLRKDLRAFVNKNGKPMLASAVLSTIIYCLENRIDLEQLKKFKLVNIPKLTPPPSTGVAGTAENPTPRA